MKFHHCWPPGNSPSDGTPVVFLFSVHLVKHGGPSFDPLEKFYELMI